MAAIKETVFSEYEVRVMKMLFGADIGTINCIGSVEEESEVIKIVKKCRGVVAKSRTRGTGNGNIKVTMHIPWALYVKISGMESEDLIEGVYGYGRSSIHPEFCLTADVYDEDDIEKFKAWPRCVLSTGPARKVENGAEEVAEIEAEIAFMPDSYGYGMYEALAADLTQEVKTKWLDAFDPSIVHVSEA